MAKMVQTPKLDRLDKSGKANRPMPVAFLAQTPRLPTCANVFARLLMRSPAPLLALLTLNGCAGFFVSPTSTTTTTTTTGTATSTTGDYAYVANSSAGDTSLSEYNVSAGSLTSVGAINLGYVPVALAVAPTNSFLYVASAPGSTSPGVYLYNIAPGSGILSAANSGNVLATDTVASMAVSADGNWLFTVSSTGIAMNEYQLNTSTGGITLASTFTLPGLLGCVLGTGSTTTPASQTCSVAVSPSGNYVVVALGTAGDAVFTYSSASGITGSGFSTIAPSSAASGDFSVVLDTNNYAYIARTGSIGVYGLGSTLINTGNLTYASGVVPRGITLNKPDNYLFTANEGTGTISSFGVSGAAALNATPGSPFAGPAHVSALGIDNTGVYMVAVGYNATTGVQLYSVSSTGVLTQVAAAASGTNTVLPALVAMTH